MIHNLKKVALGAFLLLAFGPVAAHASDPFEKNFKFSLAYVGSGLYSSPGVNHVNDVGVDPEITVSLSGTIDEGSVTIPSEGVDFGLESTPVNPMSTHFTTKWSAPDGLTGEFDSSTGELQISGNIAQTVSFNGSTCTVGPIELTFSTESTSVIGSGSRFEEGIEGDGRLVGSWTSTPPPSGKNCDLRALTCKPRNSLAHGAGAFGLATEAGLTRQLDIGPSYDPDAFGIDDFQSKGGCIKDPDPDPEPEGRARISAKLKLGGRHRFGLTVRVPIRNRGDAKSGRSKICTSGSRGLRVRGKSCRTVLGIAPGSTKLVKFKVIAARGQKIPNRRTIRVKLFVSGEDRIELVREISWK